MRLSSLSAQRVSVRALDCSWTAARLMPVLLGLEVVALSAVAARLPAVRATARDAVSYAYDSILGSSDSATQVEPSREDRVIKIKLQPALKPVLLPELKANPEAVQCSPLRLKEVLEQITNAVPRNYSGDVGGVWHLLFSTSTDGTSLAHMLRTVAGDAALLVVVRDEGGKIFGAFCPELRESPHAQASGGHIGIAAVGAALSHGSDGVLTCGGSHAASSSAASGGGGPRDSGFTASAPSSSSSSFYGTGETFLFALADLELPPPPERQLSSPSPSHATRTRTVTYTYRWARDQESNEQFCRSDGGGLYIGSGGVGGVGLRLNAELREGVSGQCATFDNAPLPMVASPLAALTQLEADVAAASSSSSSSPEPSHHSTPTAHRRTELSTPPAAPPLMAPSGPSTGDLAPLGSAVRFLIARVEVWALDEHKCRGVAACRGHSRVPMHEAEHVVTAAAAGVA